MRRAARARRESRVHCSTTSPVAAVRTRSFMPESIIDHRTWTCGAVGPSAKGSRRCPPHRIGPPAGSGDLGVPVAEGEPYGESRRERLARSVERPCIPGRLRNDSSASRLLDIKPIQSLRWRPQPPDDVQSHHRQNSTAQSDIFGDPLATARPSHRVRRARRASRTYTAQLPAVHHEPSSRQPSRTPASAARTAIRLSSPLAILESDLAGTVSRSSRILSPHNIGWRLKSAGRTPKHRNCASIAASSEPRQVALSCHGVAGTRIVGATIRSGPATHLMTVPSRRAARRE